MTKILISDNLIECTGHAETRVQCAMLTALTVSSLKYITEKLHENTPHVLKDGYCMIDTSCLSERAECVIDAYKYALVGLAESYPDNFAII